MLSGVVTPLGFCLVPVSAARAAPLNLPAFALPRERVAVPPLGPRVAGTVAGVRCCALAHRKHWNPARSMSTVQPADLGVRRRRPHGSRDVRLSGEPESLERGSANSRPGNPIGICASKRACAHGSVGGRQRRRTAPAATSIRGAGTRPRHPAQCSSAHQLHRRAVAGRAGQNNRRNRTPWGRVR